MCALGSQVLPPVACKDLQVALIGEFSVGDGNFSEQAFQLASLGFIFRRLQPGGDYGVHRVVNAAYKETGHAGHAAHVAAFGSQLFEPGNVSFSEPLVHFDRKQQRDVDVDPFAYQLLEGG